MPEYKLVTPTENDIIKIEVLPNVNKLFSL